MIDREANTAIEGFVVLLVRHCFMWFVEFGGRVMVE